MAKPKRTRGKKEKAPVLPDAVLRAAAPAAIVAAGLAAHIGCLHAVFFLDDWSQIVKNPFFSGMNSLTELTYRLFGIDAFSCHAGNLFFHLLLALLVWFLGPLFFRHAAGAVPDVDFRLAAFCGALVLAVHPLCSEITHYARARDHELLGLCAFVAAAGTLLWIKRGWSWAPLALGAAFLTVLAKGPGPGHAAIAVGGTALFLCTRAELRARLWNRWVLYGIVAVPLLALVAAPSWVLTWTGRVTGTWGGGLFGLHALTQARVFWEYVARMLWPTGLCPDHLVAYTKSWADPEAWAGMLGVAVWVGAVAWLWRRGHRLVAFLLFMVAANLLLRWFYVLSELMVEYRTYPSMPWFALLAGTGAAWLIRRRRAAGIAVLAAAVAACVALTRQRSVVWSSTAALTASIERQYPWQLRVQMERTYLDAERSDADAAVAELPLFYQRLREVLAFNAASPDRSYPNWPLWAVSVEGNVADALIRAGRLAEAEQLLHRSFVNMNANHFTDEVLWASWYLERAKLENRRGEYGWARLHLLMMGDTWFYDPADYKAERDRAEKGLASAPAPHKAR